MTIEGAIEVRLAAPGDAATVGRLVHAMDEHYLGAGRAGGVTAAIGMARMTMATREGTLFAVAQAGVEPLGLACFVVIRPGHRLQGVLFLKDLFVLREARGRGIGRAMMRWLAAYARERGIGRIDLTTDEANEGATRLYESLGGERQAKLMFRYEAGRLERLAEGD